MIICVVVGLFLDARAKVWKVAYLIRWPAYVGDALVKIRRVIKLSRDSAQTIFSMGWGGVANLIRWPGQLGDALEYISYRYSRPLFSVG